MSEIKCPNCGQVFTVDEDDYHKLVRQVRDEEFARELDERLAQALDAEKAKAASEINSLKAQFAVTQEQERAKSDAQAAKLAQQAQDIANKSAIELAELKAKHESQQTRDAAELSRLQALLDQTKDAAGKEQELALAQARQESADKLAAAAREIDALRAQNAQQQKEADLQKTIAVQDAEGKAKDAQRALEDALAQAKMELEHTKMRDKEELAVQLKVKDEQIALRDREIENIRHMRQELSVKMVGESLEQHCECEFNKLRPTAFKNAYFEKDNDVVDKTKGDYIYRETDDAGNEIISIMFEMKNESEESTHRKKNEDHFAKLDRDRKKKNCEYAVLVSLLERDSDYYNTGIVDVSYSSGFEKMYVIRPQFFIPMITLLRNAALNAADARRQLEAVKQQNIDVTNFESQLDAFKDGFGRNCELASRKFQDAIKDIDDTIKKLEKIKAELTSSDRNLSQANKKLDGLTVKKLVRKNPTMKAKFEEAASARELTTGDKNA